MMRFMCEEKQSRRGVYLATVAGNDVVCEEHYRIRLRLAGFPPCCAGQFVQLQCRPPQPQAGAIVTDWSEEKPPKFSQAELTGKEPLLRRPLSLASRRDDETGVELEILYRVVGTGTHWLAEVSAGQELSVLGPLGHGLPVVDEKPYAALIGGGVGIPPMIYMSQALHQTGKTVTAFCGAQTKSLLPLSVISDKVDPEKPTRCTAEFAQATMLTCDDGSLGRKGFVTQAFEVWLDSGAMDPAELVVYSCGPEAMMRRVGDVCIARHIECYLSLERHMACGMGTCQSCIVKIRDDSEQGWSYKLCCTDGPVFAANDVIWE